MAKRADPTNMMGKGGGGASEIAAVSVGVYAQDNTGPGFQQAKANATVAGAEIGTAAGTNVARKFEQEAIGTEGGGKGILGSLRAGKKSIMKGIAGALAVPMIAKMGYDAGEAFFNALWSRMASEKTLKHEERTRQLADEYVKARDASLDDIEKNLGKHGINLPKGALQKQIDEQTRYAERNAERAKEIEFLKESVALQEKAYRTNVLTSDQVKEYEADQRRILDLQEEMIENTKRMEDAEHFVANKRKMSAQFAKDALDADVRAVLASRRNAARDTGLDNMASDVAQLRNLVRIGVRSRMADPGSGEAN